MPGSLAGRRCLITQAGDFMGPALCEEFRGAGAEVIENFETLEAPDAAERVLREAGEVDILVANLALKAPVTPAPDIGDEEWRQLFAVVVDPLPRLVRGIAPAMIARRAGKILVMGSASALRGIRNTASYAAARGAQAAYVQSAALDLAPHNVQMNLIAQNFVENPTYFPPEVQANPQFQQRLAREVPLGRLVTAREDARFAVYLCSSDADCFVGQVFPVCGGWVAR